MNGNQLHSVSIRTEPAFTFANPVALPVQGFIQVVLGVRQYDITPDGKQFVVILPPGQATTESRPTLQIQVVLNWFEELKQRAGAQ